MRNYYQTITIACCMAMSASPLAIWAQSGDEQGLEIPPQPAIATRQRRASQSLRRLVDSLSKE